MIRQAGAVDRFARHRPWTILEDLKHCPSRAARKEAKMAMAEADHHYDEIMSEIRDLKSELRDVKTRIVALPEKAAIYTASLAIHGVVWASILGTIIVLNVLGAFG